MMRNVFAHIAVAALLALGIGGAEGAVERAVHKEVVVSAPLDEVWNAWTTRDGVRTFFAPDANVDARSGGPFEIFFNPYAQPGQKGADDMRFLAVEPRRMISFTWNAPPSLPVVRQQRSVVIVRFKTLDARKTEVALHHVGWGEGDEWTRAYEYFDNAWGRVLAKLQQRFESGPVDWEPVLRQLR